MVVRPWQKGDTTRVELLDQQRAMAGKMDLNADLSELSKAGLVVTIEHEGQVLLVGGLIPEWENRATLWSLMSKHSGPYMRRILFETLKFLEERPFRRIESTVQVGFDAGNRWMRMLGFSVEGYMRAYAPDGSDMLLYARILE